MRRATLIVALNGLIAAAGGWFLAWGPLDGGPGLQVLVALLAGLLMGGLWLWQQAARLKGQAGLARRLRLGLLLMPLVILLAAGGTGAAQMSAAGLLGGPGADRAADFDRLWQSMDSHYPYFEQKGIDWEAFRERYRPQAAAAPDDETYLNIIGLMLAELNDGHTGLLSPTLPSGCNYGMTRPMAGGEAVVTAVGKTGTAAGMLKGSRLLSIGGQSIPERVAGMDPRLKSGSTEPQQEYKAYTRLLYAVGQETLTVRFETPDGEVKSAEYPCPPPAAASGGAAGSSGNTGGATPAVTYSRLESGIGLIQVPNLFDQERVAEFDQALNALMDAPAIILDLRGNGGGDSRWGDDIAGRLLAERFRYGTEYHRQRLPQFAWKRELPFVVTPRGETYTGKVAVLTDPFTVSSAEMLVTALVDSGRAVTVGRPTAGSSGNPISLELRGGGRVRFSTGDFRRIDGTPMEGIGIVPAIPVTWSRSDLLAGRDPDLEAAAQYLRK